MRKATLPFIAGKPAAASQPSGMKGMMVMVPIIAKQQPRAPRIPAFLFQKPQNKSAANSHSEPPRNQLAPRIPKTGYIQKISGPLLMNGISVSASYARSEERRVGKEGRCGGGQ